jgi:hypothetical protein
MRPLLSTIIDAFQATFVPNRWITENVIIAQEIVHSFKQMKRKNGYVGFKLDFHKAYDYLKWKFISTILCMLGFDQKFVNLIHKCISTINFTLLLNGCKSGSFSPSRGVRQGDPLSPYLYILCSEILARMINREVAAGSIKGVKVETNAPSISMFSHTNDVLLFCGTKISEISNLMKCVDKFCDWLGLSINQEKTNIFTSNGVHNQFI